MEFSLENTLFKAAFNTAECEQFLYLKRTSVSVSCSFRHSHLYLLLQGKFQLHCPISRYNSEEETKHFPNCHGNLSER